MDLVFERFGPGGLAVLRDTGILAMESRPPVLASCVELVVALSRADMSTGELLRRLGAPESVVLIPRSLRPPLPSGKEPGLFGPDLVAAVSIASRLVTSTQLADERHLLVGAMIWLPPKLEAWLERLEVDIERLHDESLGQL